MDTKLSEEIDKYVKYDEVKKIYEYDYYSLKSAFMSRYKINTVATDISNGWWSGKFWMNPPQGTDIYKWVRHAYGSAYLNRATVISILPARPETEWWHKFVLHSDVYFVQGRMRLSDNTQPVPCSVVVFKPNNAPLHPKISYLSCDPWW